MHIVHLILATPLPLLSHLAARSLWCDDYLAWSLCNADSSLFFPSWVTSTHNHHGDHRKCIWIALSSGLWILFLKHQGPLTPITLWPCISVNLTTVQNYLVICLDFTSGACFKCIIVFFKNMNITLVRKACYLVRLNSWPPCVCIVYCWQQSWEWLRRPEQGLLPTLASLLRRWSITPHAFISPWYLGGKKK